MVRVSWRGAGGALLAVSMVVSACSGGSKKADVKSSSSASSASSAAPTTTVVPGKTKFGPDDDDKIIEAAVDDVQSFYEEIFPKLYGKPFKALSGGTFPFGPDNPPPNCGGPGKSVYRQVAQNAFYCPDGDFMAWDTVNLTNDLLDNFGPFTLAIVVAHELGHAIQARHGILEPAQFITFVTEQQADCFAGAYTAHVQQGGSTTFSVDPSDLDNALGGFLLIRDPVGTDTVNDVSAHGSAFQRINAFEDGLKGGGEKCKSYEDETFNFVPEVFDPGSLDEAQRGNLPFPEVEPLVIKNLEGFWTAAFNDLKQKWPPAKIDAFDPAVGVTCAGKTRQGDDAIGLVFFCPPDDTLNWDEKNLMPAVYEIGDLAEAVVIANQYSSRAQHLAGLPTGTLDARLQEDCFTGVWVATTKTDEINKTLPEDAGLSLSPGDLDEAVSAFLEFSKASQSDSGDSNAGTAFQHVDAFRTGFFTSFNEGFVRGLNKCVDNGASEDQLNSSDSSSSSSSASRSSASASSR